jgi:hypothetical protein
VGGGAGGGGGLIPRQHQHQLPPASPTHWPLCADKRQRKSPHTHTRTRPQQTTHDTRTRTRRSQKSRKREPDGGRRASGGRGLQEGGKSRQMQRRRPQKQKRGPGNRRLAIIPGRHAPAPAPATGRPSAIGSAIRHRASASGIRPFGRMVRVRPPYTIYHPRPTTHHHRPSGGRPGLGLRPSAAARRSHSHSHHSHHQRLEASTEARQCRQRLTEAAARGNFYGEIRCPAPPPRLPSASM